MSWRIVVIESQSKLDYKMGVSGCSQSGYKTHSVR